MKRISIAIPATGILTLLSTTANAAVAPTVPEIDGGMATIAIGLTVGVVALIKEYRRRK